ncbi:hypothetical protein OAO01_01830 [Oligoflexia bacterium]|nr:hypothetical protein [Oligoflexia bacterium]
MTEYFIPYAGKQPASLNINGHKLVIVSQDRQELMDHLQVLGGDRLEELRSGASREEEQELLEDLADRIDGGVVVAPSDIELDEVIRDLQSELPWIQ